MCNVYLLPAIIRNRRYKELVLLFSLSARYRAELVMSDYQEFKTRNLLKVVLPGLESVC